MKSCDLIETGKTGIVYNYKDGVSPSGRTYEYYDNALTDCEEWLDGEYKREEDENYEFYRSN